MPDTPGDLGKIGPLPEAPADEARSAEQREIEDLEAAQKRALIQAVQADTAQRPKYARLIFLMSFAWLALIATVIVFQGFRVNLYGHRFRISDNVILALVGGSTANVLGILFAVIQNMFPKRDTRT